MDLKSVSYFDLIENFNIGFQNYIFYFLCILVTSVFYLVFSFLVAKINGPYAETNEGDFKISKILAIFSTSEVRLSAIGVFLLFFHLFIWFAQLFLTNNIKTNTASDFRLDKCLDRYWDCIRPFY